ncbi:MAG TPA: DNA-directed RNA polymerase subunit omega [Acidimicrobiales bacterium]|nr:DNA-directed RNA polymerase subunit omega [Acidimicrobiales bacterium]
MAQRRNTLMDPPIEDLLDKVDSKFTLVALSAKRARQINSYYNQLGEGLGMVVPPQVTSVSGKPLTIAFEEISAGKATYHRLEPGEEVEGLDGTLVVTAAEAAAAEAAAVLGTASTEPVDLGILDITPAVDASADDSADESSATDDSTATDDSSATDDSTEA